MSDTTPSDNQKAALPSEYQRFADVLKHILSVPKEEIDRRKEQWRKEHPKKDKPKKEHP